MFIERMLVSRFRHLRDVELGPFRPPAQIGELIVLAGPNGSGKSSLLELLSLGIANRYNYQYHQARQMTEHAFGIKLAFSDTELAHIESETTDAATVDYLRRVRGYWVHVNLPKLFGANEQAVNDGIHAIASREFANFGRRFGFFIRSDRAYGARTYRRDQLFGWKNRMQPHYFQGLSYSSTNTQYEDMYDYLVEQSYHYVYELGLHSRRQLRGEASVAPNDPLQPYNQLLGQLFPGYEFQEVASEDFTLKVKIPSGAIIPFQDMSSGEKEVFFILAFFIRNDVSAAPIVIDEPELHLHPELARKFIRNMRNVRPENQIWIATHSADLIDEAGRERTIYVRRRADDPAVGECIPADSEESEVAILRDLFGYSGFVGISRKVVFSEGDSAGADRKTFASLFPELADEIKIIPAGSATNLHRINRAILALLESDFARCEFYLIRDRDYLSDDAVQKHITLAQGRLFILDRCQIENYLLDEEVIAGLLKRVFQQESASADVRSELFQIAAANSATFLRDMVVSRYGELYQQEDCSIGNHSQGLSILDGSAAPNRAVLEPLRSALLDKIRAVNEQVQARLSQDHLDAVFNECHARVLSALDPLGESWKSVFPGKVILQRFSATRSLGRWPALQNLIIEAMAEARPASLGDLREIFAKIGGK